MEKRMQREHGPLGQDITIRAPWDAGGPIQDGQGAPVRRLLEGIQAHGHGGFGRHGLYGPGGVRAAQEITERGKESRRKLGHG